MTGVGVLTQPVTMGAALRLSKHGVIGAGHNIPLPAAGLVSQLSDVSACCGTV